LTYQFGVFDINSYMKWRKGSRTKSARGTKGVFNWLHV